MSSNTTEAYFFALGEQAAKAAPNSYNYEERLENIEYHVGAQFRDFLATLETKQHNELTEHKRHMSGLQERVTSLEHRSSDVRESGRESGLPTKQENVDKQVENMKEQILGGFRKVHGDTVEGLRSMHADFMHTAVQVLTQLSSLDRKVSNYSCQGTGSSSVTFADDGKEALRLQPTNGSFDGSLIPSLPPLSSTAEQFSWGLHDSHQPEASELEPQVAFPNVLKASPALTERSTSSIPITPASRGRAPTEISCFSGQYHQDAANVDVEKIEDLGEDEDEDECDQHDIRLKRESSLSAVFSNAEELSKSPFHVEDLFWKTGICQKIARNDSFAQVTITVVMINAVYIGVESDYNNATNLYKADWIFQFASQFFCSYFTLELAIRFIAFENLRDCMKDGWFKFDLFLVLTMILDTWIIMPAMLVMGGGVVIPTQPLRMLRILKLCRMARLMKAFPELVLMVKSLAEATRAIASSMILIALLVYVFAIMMHMLMKDDKKYNTKLWEEHGLGFDTVIKCMWTLLMCGTFMLDHTAPLFTDLLFSREVHFVLAGSGCLFFTGLSALCILQMLIGVLCDVVSRASDDHRQAEFIGLVKQELLAELSKADDGDGQISENELRKVLTSKRSKAVLKRLNIDRTYLHELHKIMFKRPGATIPLKDVLEAMVMCRADNVVTVQVMSGGIMGILKELQDLKDKLGREVNSLS